MLISGHVLQNLRSEFMKTSFLYFVVLTCLAGCNKNHVDTDTSPTIQELNVGMLRIMALTDKNLDQAKMEEIYQGDFDKLSKQYNPQTKCTEYTVYPYGKKKSPATVGFDSAGRYVYCKDTHKRDPSAPEKILWVDRESSERLMTPGKSK